MQAVFRKTPNTIRRCINMTTEEFERSLHESYIFSGEDSYINFELFTSNKCNLVLVTGLSGSGKSTLSKNLARRYNAEVIQLDMFDYKNLRYYEIESLQDVFQQFSKDCPTMWTKIYYNKEPSRKYLYDAKRKFIFYCVEFALRHPEKKYIIEGIQIYDTVLYKEIKQYPIIIKNTSTLRSIARRIKRGGPKELLNEFPKLVAWYIDEEQELQKFIDSIEY